GTDLNEEALEAARQGNYQAWSLRGLAPALRRRYFRRGVGYELDPAIRAMVTFRPLNLVQAPFPTPAAGVLRMDLILCRNVFIYFERAAVARVMRNFAETLVPGGY